MISRIFSDIWQYGRDFSCGGGTTFRGFLESINENAVSIFSGKKPGTVSTDNYRLIAEPVVGFPREDEFTAKLSVPTLFAAFPGDVAELTGRPFGLKGSFKVGKTVCFANGENAGTEIVLTGRKE